MLGQNSHAVSFRLTFIFFVLILASVSFSRPAPTVADLRAAYAGRPIVALDEARYRQFLQRHSGYGRNLTGPLLASAFKVSKPKIDSVDSLDSAKTPASSPRALREIEERARRKDSLAQTKGENTSMAGTLDTLVRGANPDASESEDRKRVYVENFFLDMQSGDWDWNLDGGDWAAVIYVVVGVVVVSAAVLYGPFLFYNLITNQENDPIFQEIGLRYSYSGKAWSGGGPPLYREANLMGMRYAVGLDKRGIGLGLAVEGGYINMSLSGEASPTHALDFQGGYLVAGPLLRFGNNDPASFSLEFLNGSSNHKSIGWISKSRMTVQGRVGPRGLLMGAHLGAVFYDLKFYDGLVQRRGDFNRDLSLIVGIDTGWEF